MDELRIDDTIAIPLSELEFRAVRAQGAGGSGGRADAAALSGFGGFDDELRTWVASGRPLLAVCLGLQLLAAEQDRVLERIERAGVQKKCGPKLNPKKDPEYWLSQPGSPKAKVNEKPKGETVNYDQLIQAWREGRVK